MLRLTFAVAIISLVLASCTDVTNVSPGDSALYLPDDYVWASGSTSLSMMLDSTRVFHFSLADSASEVILTDPTGTTHFRSSLAGKEALGLHTGSVVDLDSGCYFSLLDTVRYTDNRPRCATYLESSGALYVGADSGMFVRSSSATNFQFAGLAGVVTALTFSSQKSLVFAGLGDGSIWSGSVNNWSELTHTGLPAGAIQSLAFGVDQSLYAAVQGAPGFYRYSDGDIWTKVAYMESASIECLHAFATSLPRVQKAIVVAASDGQIGVFNLDGTANPAARHIAGEIFDFTPGDGGALLAATDVGVLSGDLHNNQWTPLTNPISAKTEAIHTWYPTSGSPVIFFGASTRVEYAALNGASRNALQPLPDGALIALGHAGQKLYAITTRGCYQYESSGWVLIPGLGNRTYYHDEGPLIILHNPMQIGGAWKAGLLMTPSHDHAYDITGRLLAHYDTLRAGTFRYPDVLMIRFAEERADLTAESHAVPYWMLYFGRNHGVVMAEKVRDDSVVSRLMLVGNN